MLQYFRFQSKLNKPVRSYVAIFVNSWEAQKFVKKLEKSLSILQYIKMLLDEASCRAMG